MIDSGPLPIPLTDRPKYADRRIRAEEGKMFGCNAEVGLADALADPIVRTIMNADHADPQTLEVSLRETTRKVAAARRPRATNES